MSETLQTIGRLRRAMPRNVDVMDVCDKLEKLMVRSSAVERLPVKQDVAGSMPAEPAKPKLTRAQIQKNYRLRKKVKLV